MKAGAAPFHPLYAPLAPWLKRDPLPSIDDLNQEAAARGLVSGGGQPLSFRVPDGRRTGYERRLYGEGVAETRNDNWHDYFGALAWLAFPAAKAAINRRHFAALSDAAGPERGPARDALTQFDECGLVVLCADMALWQGIRAHCWREVFGERRQDVLAGMRFLLFGHGSYDSLRAPYVGLCAKAVCFAVDAGVMGDPLAAQVARADELLAQWLATTEPLAPKLLQPIPLLGIPGATADNENPAYYDDTRQFRPARRVQSSREVRQAIAVSQGIEESPGPLEQDAG